MFSLSGQRARLATLVSVVAVGATFLVTAPLGGCGDDSGDAGGDAGFDSGVDSGEADAAGPNLTPSDASGQANCTVNGIDYIDFCLQKTILRGEHAVFDPKNGVASSWSATTFAPNSDGGSVLHDYRDDVAYGSSLSIYLISENEYSDTQLDPIITADLSALAPLVESEFTTLPASYDGELYLRLRRLAEGLSLVQDTANGAKITAIADAYGRAIYSMSFHPLALTSPDDAGTVDASEDGSAPLDAAVDSSTPDSATGPGTDDAGSDGGLHFVDGILGTPAASGGIAYDVDQAASGALALVDMANRHATDDASQAAVWAQAAGVVFNHLYARARHSSGLYYSYLVTSSDPGHDALDTVLTPSDTLLTETQGSVMASMLRAVGILTLGNVPQLSASTLNALVVVPLNSIQGTPSLWDTTSNSATLDACGILAPSSGITAPCGGTGFFSRELPSTTGVDMTTKTIRGNALLFAAIHRAIQNALSPVPPTGVPLDAGIGSLIDYEPLTTLFTSQVGVTGEQGTEVFTGPVNLTFLTQVSAQNAYPSELAAGLTLVPGDANFTAQANAYAIEALTEQWVGRAGCPLDFY
jgi:hypothetical protein